MSENKTHTPSTNVTLGCASKLSLHHGLLVACVFALVIVSTVTPAATYAQDENVLFNEGFEGEFKGDPYCKSGTCNVPSGWGVWFIPRRETDQPGINFQPQYVQVKSANRVKSGSAAQHIYTENATHTGGIFRIVTNVKVGSKLRFSAWGESWSTNDESPISARPSPDIKLKIGIDPMGGNNGQASPLNGQVVWSEEHDAKDSFTQFTVEAEAKSQTVIVYMYSTMKEPVRHNEVFWDDAVLEYTAPPPTATVTPTLEAGGSVTDATGAQAAGTAPAETPTSAPTVQASSGITHTVVEGDTLFAIALKYDKSVEEIKRLNNLSNDLLQIGQVLIIEPPTEAVSIPAAEATAAQAVPSASPTPDTGALCVQAYFDNNGNGERDDGEELVPNVLFNLTANDVAVQSYTTDGANEPYCIGNLNAGAYTVAATIMPAYNATTPLNDTANIPGGEAVQFAVGLRRVSDGNQMVEVTGTPVVKVAASSAPNILAILATIVGGLIILGAIGAGMLFFLQSRRL
ncbi:MAG: LysM peptidoglycan-binding domain-containing protein [Chloroflexi bacterium]|nr:LysM peptidoglycan-binding domain-containing protein [Chloroflexota bacterium]